MRVTLGLARISSATLSLQNNTTGVREREDTNRTREAGNLDEIQAGASFSPQPLHAPGGGLLQRLGRTSLNLAAWPRGRQPSQLTVVWQEARRPLP